jgi:hypothetical protein
MNKFFLTVLIVLPTFLIAQENPRFVNYKWDLFRAVQGTIQLSREQSIGDKYTFNIGLMGTYASTRGLAKPYLKAQNFEYKDPSSSILYNLENVQALGSGLNIQFRKYLGKKPKAGYGFYLTPEVFYRFLNLESEIYNSVKAKNETVRKTLNLGYIGYSVGYQKIYREMLSIDSYLGGGFFLSKYDDQSELTKFRNSYQLDYTGFYLNMGILIGIVK